MVANARRVFVALFILLGVMGALNQTVFPALFGGSVDLVLPHLRYGHDMFHSNPRRIRVGRYRRADGIEHDLSDLVPTPSLGYKRSRTALNLIAHPDYIRELCFHAARTPGDELTILVDEYQVDADPRRPTQSFQLSCDGHGLKPR